MTQLTQASDCLELTVVAGEANELEFLEDSSYEYVGGGDAFNGY